MTTLSDAVDACLAAAGRPLKTRAELAPAPRAFAPRSFQDLLDAARGRPADELTAAVARLAGGLGVPDPYQAGRLALLAGTLVEWGADHGPLVAPLFDRLAPVLARAADYRERLADPAEVEGTAGFEADPAGYAAWMAVEFLGLAAMTVLTRDPAARAAARAHGELCAGVERLRGPHDVVWYLGEVLDLADGLDVLVLHPESRRGFVVRLEGVRNNFHFFTLLQARLTGDGRVPGRRLPPRLVAAARGEAELTEETEIEGEWGFYEWPAVDERGRIAAPAERVWGELHPRDIRPFEGRPVVVLGPLDFARQCWDAKFVVALHDAHRADVRVRETFEPDEVDAWVRRLAAAPRPGRPIP